MAIATYDAFVSYSSKDRHWVHRVLIRKLVDAGLKIAHDKLFGPGGLSRANIEKMIDDSRHVILVLTPAWSKSRWTRAEYHHAEGGDPDGRDMRILPLLRKAVRGLPQRLADITHDDCTDSQKAKEAVAKTIERIRESANRPANGCSDQACEALRRYEEQFLLAQRRIALLTAYKAVHDQLHVLQVQGYTALVKEVSTPPPEDATPEEAAAHAVLLSASIWENIESLIPNVADVIAKLREIERDHPSLRPQLTWLKLLERACVELHVAVEKKVVRCVHLALELMEDVLGNQPLFNKGLVENARALDLEHLVGTIDRALETARKEKTPSSRFQEIEKARSEIGAIQQTLTELVDHHDNWQAADLELRRIDRMLRKGVSELLSNWPSVREQIAALERPGEHRVARMMATAKEIDDAVAEHDEVRLPKLFRRYRADAVLRFYEVDGDLKDRCARLRAAGEPLATVARTTA